MSRVLLAAIFVLALSAPLAPVSPKAAAQAPEPLFIRLQAETFDPVASWATQTADSTDLQLIQFVGPVQESWKEAVRAVGGTLYGYIPDHAFIARFAPGGIERALAFPEVRWVGPFRGAYRVSSAPVVADHAGLSTYTVQTLPDAEMASLEAGIAALGGDIVGSANNGLAGYLRVRVAPRVAAALGGLDGVVWVEPYVQPTLHNERATAVMGMPTVRQDLGLYGAGQIVAVADSGLDSGDPATIHPDFRGKVVNAYCLVRVDPCNWADDNGHGTHVAGSVLGSGVASGADPAQRRYGGSEAGAAPEARLVVQAIGGWGSTIFSPVDAGDLVRLALRDGAAVHTNSWGGAVRGAYTADSQQFDYVTWQNPSVLALFSAGNSGVDRDRSGRIDPGSLGAPGSAKNVLTVGASENNRPEVPTTWGQFDPDDYGHPPFATDPIANRTDGMAAFSSRGPTADGRLKPDVVAPGTRVRSAFSRLSPLTGATAGTSYRFLDGTSMATPLVAGGAAVVREWLQTRRAIPTPSGALIKALLINGTADPSPGQYGADPATQEVPEVRPNWVSGFGRVDVAASIAPAGQREVWLVDRTLGLRTGESVEWTVRTTASGPLRATLVWTDYPGQPAAAKQLVNDLDLEVIGPDGVTRFGNAGAYPVGDRCLRGQADTCNTAETVIVSAAAAGTYTLRVRAFTVPQGGRQPFALVVSGVGIGQGPGQTSPIVSSEVGTGGACPAGTPSGVYIFDRPSFEGKCAYFTADSPFADRWEIGNDQAQSVRIVGAYRVALFSDIAYSGRSIVLDGPRELASLDGLAVGPKQASSVQVRFQGASLNPPPTGGHPHVDPAVTQPGGCPPYLNPETTLSFWSGLFLYTEPNYAGRCQRVALGDPSWFTSNANMWWIGNDAVQSFRLIPRRWVATPDGYLLRPQHGFRVTLYSGVNYGGVSTSFTTIAAQHPDMRTPPSGYLGPWVGTKTISSVRLEIVQLDAQGNLPRGELVEGSFGRAVYLPFTSTAN